MEAQWLACPSANQIGFPFKKNSLTLEAYGGCEEENSRKKVKKEDRWKKEKQRTMNHKIMIAEIPKWQGGQERIRRTAVMVTMVSKNIRRG